MCGLDDALFGLDEVRVRAHVRFENLAGIRGPDGDPHDALLEHVAMRLDEDPELNALGLELLDLGMGLGLR